jgi:serine protease AprX
VGLEVYPNPFRAYTAISYSLLEPGFVTIDVYDMGGRKITSLLGEYKQQGVYHLDYNTQFLEKGVYILQMKTRSVQVVKKILKQ